MTAVFPTDETVRRMKRIRWLVALFIVGLTLSGITAFPLVPEVDLLASWLGATGDPAALTGVAQWVATVRMALHDTQTYHPFLFYGTDWLAFGHLIIALFFIGLYQDPIRNVFILRVGIAACVLVWPLAFICGAIRGIPFYWQLIDCSFGVFGLIPLVICLREIQQLESLQREARQS